MSDQPDSLVLRPPRWVRWRGNLLAAALVVSFLLTLARPAPGRLIALGVVFVVSLPAFVADRRTVVIDRSGVRRSHRFLAWSEVAEIDTGGLEVRPVRGRPLRLPGRIEPEDVARFAPDTVHVS